MNLLETRGPHGFGPWHVTQVVEWEGDAMPYDQLFPGVSLEAVRKASPAGARSRLTDAGGVIMSTQFFLLERDHQAILVDTGTGNDKQRPAEPHWHNHHLPYRETLGSLGVSLEDVTHVFLTHLHVDHVGWCTSRRHDRWTPTFPKARYIINRAEWDFWNSFPPGHALRHPCLDDSVLPLVEADAVQWAAPGALVAGLRLHDAPGHTPGGLVLELEGTTAWFSGDLFHHPAQMSRPDWPSNGFDENQEVNARTRARFLEKFAEFNATVFGAHLGNGFQVAATAAGGFFPKSDVIK
jgi:glyoxylase-like metal-dependent hydrolase (beta-lactamase superfamily II)